MVQTTMEISDWLRAIDEQTDMGGKLRILSNWTEQSNRRFSCPPTQIPVKSSVCCIEEVPGSIQKVVFEKDFPSLDTEVERVPSPVQSLPISSPALIGSVDGWTSTFDKVPNMIASSNIISSSAQQQTSVVTSSVQPTSLKRGEMINYKTTMNENHFTSEDGQKQELDNTKYVKVPYVRKLFDRMFDRMNVKNLILRSGENIWDPGIDIIMKFEEDVTKGSLMECMISIRNLDPGLCYLDVYGAAGIITQMDCLINNTDVLEATSYANNNELPVGLVTLHFFQFVFGQQGNREFMVEVEMLSRLHHPNLVKLANYYSNHHSSQDLLCYKLVSNGSLESWLHGPLEANCPIDWDNIMKITLGATRGFAYLHEDSQSCVSHGDFKERVKILENTSHLPLAYIAVLVHRLHNVAESLTGELGDNVSHLYKEKVLSLMIPPTPVIDSSDWPFLKVIKGIFEGRLDNIRKADMGEDEGTANFVGQVIQATERNMNDVDELNYDFRNPFVTCGEGGFLAASTQVISCSSC